MKLSAFAQDLLAWYDRDARELPWRSQKDPYAIWVSEVMLQQTQVNTVIPYYNRFLERFPDMAALAGAEEEDVLKLWEGLGYYRRARLLMQGVREVQASYGGELPKEPKKLSKLPGVGCYMAGALASIAYDVPAPAVDGNVIRVVTRILAWDEDSASPNTRRRIEIWIMERIARDRAGDFNQAMMELGAMICRAKSPRCEECPVRRHCTSSEGQPELYPVKKPAKRLTVEKRALYIVQWEGRRFLLRRPSRGLLGGLWEYPNSPVTKDAEIPDCQWVNDLIGRELTCTFLGTIVETFSHLRWEIDVYKADLVGEITIEDVGEKGWFLPDEISDLACANFVRKINSQFGFQLP